MVNMRRILILLLLFLAMFTVPVSADSNYSSSGTISFYDSYSDGYYLPYSTYTTSFDIYTDRFGHRFTDAKIITTYIFKNHWGSSLSYSKNSATSFTSTVLGSYYGSGVISVVEQLDGSIWFSVEFNDVDEDYAITLTGDQDVMLTYDSSIWDGVTTKSGNRYYATTLTADKPGSVRLIFASPRYVSYIGSAANSVLVSYVSPYVNTYDYSFNSIINLSSLSISRSSDASIWSVFDDSDYLYFEDQTSYSTTSIDQDFVRYQGVYANTTFNTGGGPVSVYTTIDFNGTAVAPDTPSGGFDYNITAELDEYSPGDIVNVTYSTDIAGSIQVVDTVTDQVFHSKSFGSGAINGTWQYYISEVEDFGFFDVYLLDSNDAVLDSYRYILLPQDALESYLHIVQSSVNLYEEININVQTANASIFTIENPDGVEVWNDTTFGAQEYRGITFTPTVNPGVYTAYLYDDATLSDTIIVYSADAAPITDPDTNETTVEDVLAEDETINEYFDGKFRDFAPLAWSLFVLAVLLWFMSILTSFGKK